MSTESRLSRYRVPRYAISVPVNITVLRSGIPDSIPGRLLNIGEGGVAAVLAAELRPGDSAAIEFRLPDVALPLRAKAVVRHQSDLRCGLAFLALSPEQRTMIQYWADRVQIQTQMQIPVSSSCSPASRSRGTPARHGLRRRHRLLQTGSCLALLAFLCVGGAEWWRWHRAWHELESRIRNGALAGISGHAPAQVAAGTMERLLTHKVDPVYPDDARKAKLEGVVLIDAVIGSNGTVLHVQPLSGPEMLESAAVDAVKWWRFRPYDVNGEPIDVETTIAVGFPPGA
jgi:TonB family protein